MVSFSVSYLSLAVARKIGYLGFVLAHEIRGESFK